ncbi:hypothetical protein DSO57_1004117 [Entomophthora muscae]|uniref:Uncharacterized protein n=1 Tax=Entomophthora muscae TaxID=34485 RepID=A0ACC2TJA2_9FUNG|nr:hypothetical protein DSO57_1004117 [Entomophthora muscae]
MGAGNDTHIRKYTPLLKAQRSASIEILNERFRQRKLRRTLKDDLTEASQADTCPSIQATTF